METGSETKEWNLEMKMESGEETGMRRENESKYKLNGSGNENKSGKERDVEMGNEVKN